MRADSQGRAGELLNRELFRLSEEALETFAGKTILVTGGAGSIGSTLVRRLVSLRPDAVVVMDNAEDRLYALQRQHAKSSSVQYVLGDINFREDLRTLCRKHRPQIIFHAAAHKYIDFLQTQPFAAVRANVFGTRNVLDEATGAGVETIVVLSSDKASSPVSVLGATKRLAELLALQSSSAKVCAVRLCNVLGSTGSLLPLIEEQVQSGTVTVTDNAAERFFIAPQEAADLLLSAAIAGERGILIPAQASRVNIRKLVERIIRRHSADHVQITVSGLRPGEKLMEQLYSATERVQPAADGLLKVVGHSTPTHLELDHLEEVFERRDEQQLIDELKSLIPEYRPASDAVSPISR